MEAHDSAAFGQMFPRLCVRPSWTLEEVSTYPVSQCALLTIGLPVCQCPDAALPQERSPSIRSVCTTPS